MNSTYRMCTLTVLAFVAAACGGGGGGSMTTPTPTPNPLPPAPAPYQDVSATNLTTGGGICMDAAQGDLDGDGDIDLVLAQELGRNLVLLNDGTGIMTLTAGAVNGGDGDNEDVRLGDIDNDGDLDMFSAHEDDRVHALLVNNGSAVFSDVSSRIPVTSTANATELIDLNDDGRLDILLGNQGTNIVLMQQPNGFFVDDTANRPIGAGTTQDLLLLDVDGDSDLDLFVANESGNKLLINNGNDFFTDETAARLPASVQESREADAADIDNDGDLDIVVGNVRFIQSLPIANQVLVNDGVGNFTDASATALANVDNTASSFTIRFFDIDGDNDPDILSPRNQLGTTGSIDVWINNGNGVFSTATQNFFSITPVGSAFDIEIVDVNNDGNADIYVCYRTGRDQLFLRM